MRRRMLRSWILRWRGVVGRGRWGLRGRRGFREMRVLLGLLELRGAGADGRRGCRAPGVKERWGRRGLRPAGFAGRGVIAYQGAYDSAANYAAGRCGAVGGVELGVAEWGRMLGIRRGWLRGHGGCWRLRVRRGQRERRVRRELWGRWGRGSERAGAAGDRVGALWGRRELAGSPGLVYQGAYSSTGNYSLGDVVVFQGSSYASLVGFNVGQTPGLSPGYWGMLTAQGPAGSTGAPGLPGPTGAAGRVGAGGTSGMRPGRRVRRGLRERLERRGFRGLRERLGCRGRWVRRGPRGRWG